MKLEVMKYEVRSNEVRSNEIRIKCIQRNKPYAKLVQNISGTNHLLYIFMYIYKAYNVYVLSIVLRGSESFDRHRTNTKQKSVDHHFNIGM